MKAIVFHRYGPPEVLQVSSLHTPSPKAGEVRIQVKAVTVNAGDCEIRSAKIPNAIWFFVRLYFGFFAPRKKILGIYFAGIVDEVGTGVTNFQKGDAIFACSGTLLGAYAQYICMPAKKAIAIKPKNVDFESASTLGLGLDALHFLRKANIQRGQKVLINGAGGGIGTIAVQLAKYNGAIVTAVDHTDKHKMLQSIGVDIAIDYTKENFADRNDKYDIIFDLVGKKMFRSCIRSLTKNGTLLLANPAGLGQMLRGKLTSLFSRKKVVSSFATAKARNLQYLQELVEAGHLRPIVDMVFPFTEVVKAHHRVESGQKKGNVVLHFRDA
ncbi:MAG TPA: NAD(P)-dependent alcohol dehydrogenase [Chitinophagaceae bacterium]|nr:NAD(P)-dependent alcohol dehydrogenase [Chitinophagaceae bacterium]